MEKIPKILLMHKGGEYCFAKKRKDKLTLEPIAGVPIYAESLVPYGISFEFGKTKEINFGIYEYGHAQYDFELGERKLNCDEDYGKVNLHRTIMGLDNLLKEKEADYVLIVNFISRDRKTFWDISGKAQLFIERRER